MRILIRVLKEAKRYKWLLIIAALSTLALTALNLAAPRLLSSMVDIVSEDMGNEDLKKIITLMLVLLGLYLVKILFRYLSSFLSHKAAWNLVEQLRIKLYSKVQSLPLQFFKKHQSGDLVSRTLNDTASFEQLYAHLLPESLTYIVTIAGVSSILCVINYKLALLTCIPIPFILFSGWIFIKKIRPYFRKRAKEQGLLAAQLQDNYSGIAEIQAFSQQEHAATQVKTKASYYTKSLLKALNLTAVFHPVVEFLTSCGTLIVVGVGGYLAYKGQTNAADIVAFLLYLSLFYAPITGLAQLIESVNEALAGAERVIEIMDAPQTVQNKPDAAVLERADGAIKFENVSFFYDPAAPVLQNVSFEVKPGQMVALVGATGVGKSTIAQLASRFYDPIEGRITLDGTDLRDYEINSLHRNIAMVMQDTFLFNGTIAQNIAFAKSGADDLEIVNAAKIARIHDDIIAMPDGYLTQVGERGAKLSGGQKQRIAIARAVISNAPVLILDEATASVDVGTEAYIRRAISELCGKRTIIAIAHRLSTVKRADNILVLKDGKVVQSGNHDTLYAEKGIYRDMWQIQQDEQEQ